MIKKHPLKGPNRLKLGVFSTNADGGLAITDVPERWLAGWDDNLTAAQIADRAGLEFFLPIARWKGFGGKNRVREHSFETFTWAAGLAAATERIGLFMTVHVPLVHPLYAAKALATVDHISHGRAGLNIVCGWNPKEFGMFGTPLVEKGYDQAAEWIEIVEKLYASDEPIDYDGDVLPPEGSGQPAGEPAEAAAGDDERGLRRSGPRLRVRPLRLSLHHLLRDRRGRKTRRRHQPSAPTRSAARSAATRSRMLSAARRWRRRRPITRAMR